MSKSDHSDRTRAERIERLRERLKQATGYYDLIGVLKGVLDLLGDEL